MSKLLANQIANYNDNGPVEVKEGVNIPTGKPLQAAGAAGTTGDYLKSTGTGVVWETFPTIPSAQVQADWNLTSGIGSILNKPTFHPVAISGSYNDLVDQPNIPLPQVNSDWSATSGIERILNKPALFSGSYSDLTNRPSIPATITDLAGVNLPNPIPDGAYIQWDTATTKWIVGTGSQGILDLVEDTSPQLGGNLDANGFYIDMGNLVITDTKVGQWDLAYSWGDHSTQGYLKSFTNTTYSQATIGDAVGVKLRLTDSFGTQDDILITAGTGITIDQIGTEGFRLNSSGGAGGGATVTTDDNAPSTPNDGELWWKSDEGRLKVFYSDVNGSQWVDANPPLSPSFAPAISNGTVELEAASEGSGNTQQQFLKMTGHLLPATNATYDIGSAEKKIRHLFLSDNSLWLHDNLRMSNHQGKVKFYTRDTEKLPTAIVNAVGSWSGVLQYVQSAFPARNSTQITKDNANGHGYFITDFLGYLCDLTNAPIGTYQPEDLWPSERLNGDVNPNFDSTDWDQVNDLIQDGKNVAPQLNDDADQYDLRESRAFLRTSALTDFPVKLIGSQAVEGTYINITVFVPQGNTPRNMTVLSIDGTDATQLKITGTPEANTTNTFSIKAIYFGAEWKATVAIG